MLFVLVLAAYAPAIRGEWVWNDADYVTNRALQSWHGLWRIWFEVGATEQYYPFLHTAFWVEHRLWGDAAVGYHLVNLLWHAGAAGLFGLVLRRLSVPGAPLAALLFALHPVCVESVAWISEQKNTLSAVFYLGAALSYLAFAERRERRYYALGLGLFVLALLTKTVAATLPGALGLVLWWRRGRLDGKEDLVPLLPWFGLGAASGLFSAWVERTYLGAQGADFALSIGQRWLVAGHAFWFYLGKAIWPARLIFIYPRWHPDVRDWTQHLYPIGAIALLSALALAGRRSGPRAVLTALLFFAGSLFPVLGFFNVYAFIFSFVADHFQYLALMGLAALAAAAWVGWTEAAAAARVLAWPVAAAAALALAALTWRQCQMYATVETFYRTILARNPDAWMAQMNLGDALFQKGALAEAAEHFRHAAQIKPAYAEAHYNLGNTLARVGQAEAALASYQEAVRLKPGYFEARNDLGAALVAAHRLPEAIENYRAALRLKPAAAETHFNLGIALNHAGRGPEAESEFTRALQLRPDFAEAHYNLGLLLAKGRRGPEAIAQFEAALRLNPNYPGARKNLGAVLAAGGRWTDAIAQFEAALALAPGDAALHHNLGVVLQAAGMKDEAQVQFATANRLKAAAPSGGP